MSEFNDKLKQTLISRIDFQAEFSDVLGPKIKGRSHTTRPCYNNAAHSDGDKNPSLSFSPRHGGYKCHACGEKGDIFTLYMKSKGWDFPQTLQFLLKKYGLWTDVPDFDRKRSNRKNRDRKYQNIGDERKRNSVKLNRKYWDNNKYTQFFLRYGVNEETIKKYWLGIEPRQGTVWIPIWADGPNPDRPHIPAGMVNIRKHDCFRTRCAWEHSTKKDSEGDPIVSRRRPQELTDWDVAAQNYGPWKPVWGARSGKVTNEKGHGKNYLYPFHVMKESASVYLVGGELKALLLNQLGKPAVTFTGGETSWEPDFMFFFTGKEVRVLMDIDKTGIDAAETLAQILADYGAYVKRGDWTEQAKKMLPPKGDVTDLLRIVDWNASVLDDDLVIKWTDVERRETLEEIQDEIVQAEEIIPDFKDMKTVHFNDLINPELVGEWVRSDVVISGRGASPFVVPKVVRFSCETGMTNPMRGCAKCGLHRSANRAKKMFDTDAQVELIGMSGHKLDAYLRNIMDIPLRCSEPDIDIKSAAVETTVVVPTLEVPKDGKLAGDFHFAHRKAHLLSDKRLRLKENIPYTLGGKIVSDPKTGRFSLACVAYEKARGDIFRWKYDKKKDDQLKNLIRREGIKGIVNDVRDNVVIDIYGQDQMILAMMLSFFLPFSFTLGRSRNKRISPAVMIMGDTNTGKSTVSKALIMHYGAGKYASADADPTFPGIVGGHMKVGNDQPFSWGLLPTSHRGAVHFDEFAKVDERTIAKLTNTLSDGVAERITAGNQNRTLCWVRLMYMTNPRRGRLTGFRQPLDAVKQVMGEVQDLGRLEYAWVQMPMDPSIFDSLNDQLSKPVEHKYTHELARYHLSWAWSLSHDQIKFQDDGYVMARAHNLAKSFSNHPLLLIPQSRWKIARVAAGFASLCYNYDDVTKELLVTNAHVDMACTFINACYSPWLHTTGQSDSTGSHNLPESIVELFDTHMKGKRVRYLNMLVSAQRWTRDDLDDVFSQRTAQDFIELAQLEFGLIGREGKYYRPMDASFQEGVEQYIADRRRKDG